MNRSRLVIAFGLFAACLVGLVRADDDKPIRALLVCGGCCHDYGKQKDLITKGISERANVSWKIAYEPSKEQNKLNPVYEKPDWAKGFDVIVHDECTSQVVDLALIDRILQPHKDGLPALVLHCAMHSYRSAGWPDKTTPWFEFTGVASTKHDKQAPIAVEFVDSANPITKGMQPWTTVNEELYNNSTGKLLDTAKPLMRGKQTVKTKDKKDRTDEFVVSWTNKYNRKANVFGTTLGHNNETVNDPRYLDLLTRGLLWSVGKLDAAHLKPAKKVMLDDAK